MKDLIQKILAEDHVLEIRSPRYKPEQIPELDESRFKKRDIESARRSYEALKEHLCERYTLLYDITDQEERHGFEWYLKEKYGSDAKKLIGKSLLGVGKQQGARSNLYYLLRDLKKPNPKAEEIQREIDMEWKKGYQRTSNEQKVKFAEMLQDRIYEVLKLLSVKRK